VIDRKINSWAQDMNAYVKKYEPDQYLIIFEYEYLSLMEEKRFNILDIMRETQSGNKIPITLSIGVGTSEQKGSLPEIQELSKSALDIALARGGDQAVLRKDGKLSYFGGKTQAVEKRTKVKARIKAHGIKELMENSEKIFIMGHDNPDIDSLGAALGIFRCAKFLGKEASIILDKSNPSIDVLYKELIKDGYENVIISSENARKTAGDNVVLVIVDVHKRNLVQAPDLIGKVGKIIVIDHHIRAAEFIEESVLTYLEPYASSTCELVSEIIEYIDDGVELTEIEATALLAGIYMDTKNFAIKTGVRTFEAASFLRKNGADTLKAKKLLKDDREVLLAKSQALKEAKFIKDNIAIAIVNNHSEKVNLITAQTADELLNIQGVEASFVVAQGDDASIISGRSYGGVNVQRILETLGGGGHMTVAGAQLAETDVETALNLLEKAIDEYLREGEKK
jgi:c-di-AMP phosphodiesterase-like protein